MKKRIIVLSVMLVLVMSVSVFADSGSFERTKSNPLEISDQLSKLENVTGWTKLPEGQWLEKKDRIPIYICRS